jgi:general secretion pathway protein I
MRDASNTRRADARQRGFTLIEVLAALIIVSLGMLGVIEAVTQTASNGSYLRDKTIAHWVAMNQLSKVRLDTRPPKIDKSSDEVEMASRKWRWTMSVTQTPVQSLRRIDISVAPAEAAKTVSMASVTGFYGAAISPVAQPVSWTGQQGAGGGGPNNPPPGETNPPNGNPPNANPPTQPPPANTEAE